MGWEEGRESGGSTSNKAVLMLAYQSLGVVYGDLSISPLYVYRSTFSGNHLRLSESDQGNEEILGVLSFILWTLTLISLFKYIFIVLAADDNGEGGTFALYSLLCRHANMGLLSKEQLEDEQQFACTSEKPYAASLSPENRAFFQKHYNLRIALLLLVLLGTSMVICDGVLTPVISVLSAVSGVRLKIHSLHEDYVVGIACVILVGLFALQHYGTNKVAFLFAPVVIIWLICIGGIGVYNIMTWNPRVLHALSPYYMYNFFKKTEVEGWSSLGGVVLCITGAEAMFADLGHFSQQSIKIAFTTLVYPSLILAYMGEAAFLSKHKWDLEWNFYKAIPEPIFWPVFILSTLAAIVGSQAIISASFSVISQCSALSFFPRVKVVHTSKQIFGQIYIPEINWLLMSLCLVVIIGLRDMDTISHAYGLSAITIMFVTTCLMSLVIKNVWKKNILISAAFCVVFGSIEVLYISVCLYKVPKGGWVALVLSLVFMVIMYVWHYGMLKKHDFDSQYKVSMKRILSLGPSLGIARVPGIGLIYTELMSGVPAVFGHFVTNLPAFHQVVIFVCVKAVQIPHVPGTERYFIGRIGPKGYKMFRCIVRYGYKDSFQDDDDFENQLITSMCEFLQKEGSRTTPQDKGKLPSHAINVEVASPVHAAPEIVGSHSGEIELSSYDRHHNKELEASHLAKDNKQKSKLVQSSDMDLSETQEIAELLAAKEAGVAYILGHSQVKAKRSSSLLKKFTINVAYAFLHKNSRGPGMALNIPHISLIKVGMIYYV